MRGHISLSQVKKVDKGEVFETYRGWAELARRGFEAKFDIPDGRFRKACVLGMGGSAAGGDIIAGWLSQRHEIEFSVFKGIVPLADMKGILAIACSASGQTKETISMLKTAAARDATAVCISSGGKLEAEASSLGVQHVMMPEVIAPRYMLPFIVFSCLSAANKGMGLGCDGEAGESIDEMRKQLEFLDVDVPFQRNKPMQLAEKLLGKTPAVLGDSVTKGVGIRFKNALNENAKRHAYFDLMPDAFHNEIQAWEGDEESFLPIFLRHSDEEADVAARADKMIELLAGLGKKPEQVKGTGVGTLSQLMTMVYHLDMTSYYIAIALGRNPLPTKLIERLKKDR